MSNRPNRPTARQDSGQGSGELPGLLGYLARNRQLLGYIHLVAAILLFYFTVTGFLGGLVFVPFGFGLMGLYFFYSYVRNVLKADFGRITLPLNMILLVGALVCLVIGLITQS